MNSKNPQLIKEAKIITNLQGGSNNTFIKSGYTYYIMVW